MKIKIVTMVLALFSMPALAGTTYQYTDIETGTFVETLSTVDFAAAMYGSVNTTARPSFGVSLFSPLSSVEIGVGLVGVNHDFSGVDTFAAKLQVSDVIGTVNASLYAVHAGGTAIAYSSIVDGINNLTLDVQGLTGITGFGLVFASVAGATGIATVLVPEPGVILLFALALVLVAGFSRRQKREQLLPVAA